MGQGELAVVRRAERPDPGVEHLDGLRACLHLGHQVVGDGRRQRLAEAVPGVGLPVHQRLGSRVVARRSTLDGVRRQGERRAAETDEGNAVGQLGAQQADGGEHVAERFARLEPAQPGDVVRRADRLVDDRAFALDEIERDAERLERQEQIREEDGGVDLDAVDRLQRHLGGQLRLAADVEQGVPLADRAVLGHVASRLAHEPDRRAVDGLAPAGAEKAVVHPKIVLRADGAARGAATAPGVRAAETG